LFHIRSKVEDVAEIIAVEAVEPGVNMPKNLSRKLVKILTLNLKMKSTDQFMSKV
jgi:hypothetical protein